MPESKTVSELLPCPFCGSDMRSFVGDHEDGFAKSSKGFLVNCDCGAMGPEGEAPQGAIDAWNGRSAVSGLNFAPSAIEQQQAERDPVAWRCEDLILPNVSVIDDWEHAQARMRQPNAWKVTPLYAHPPSPPEISDDMVERAFNAANDVGIEDPSLMASYAMIRAALTAALFPEAVK